MRDIVAVKDSCSSLPFVLQFFLLVYVLVLLKGELEIWHEYFEKKTCANTRANKSGVKFLYLKSICRV